MRLTARRAARARGCLPSWGAPARAGRCQLLAWIGVEADRLLEQVGDSDGEDAWSAASIEEPRAPIQIQILAENNLELRRVGRCTAPVVGSGAW